MTKRTGRLVAAGVTLVLATGACGGTHAPSRAAYDGQANAICASYNSKLRAAVAGLGNSTSVSQVESVLSSAVSVAQQGENRLEALKQPAGEGAQLKQVYAAQQAQIADLQRAVDDLRSGNVAAARSAVSAGDGATAALDRRFDVLGLTTCGSGSSPSSSTS